MATTGKIIKGKWRIDARLGAGATATVYAATHRNGYRVAIKMLHLDLSRDVEIRQRFLREGYVANTIQHKGIVRVLDDDVTEDGQVFLVLELLEGESLASMLTKNGGRLPWMMVAEKMVDLLDVLSTAHAQGVVHRDIKPDNVFITTEGVLKVLDFGLARLKLGDKESTRAGAILGTPDFMSPEQAAGKNDEVEARSDLYSVGATAYVLMSGQPVHTANTLQEHLHLTAHTDVQTLAKAASWVPFQLVGVIDRALSRDKQKRWATAFEMQGALKAAVEEADVVLVPDAPTVLDPEPAITPAFAQDSPPIAAVQPAAGSPAIPPSSAQAAVVAPPSRSPSARPGAPGSGRPSAPSQRAAVHVPASRPANLIVPSAIGSGRAPMSSPISARPASSGMSSRASAEHDEVDREERPTRPPPPPSSAKIQVVPESIRSVTRTPLPAKPPPSVDAAKKNGSAPEEEEEELIQRPDAPTIMDPQHEEEEAPKPQRLQPLAKWTERLLQAEAAETAVSRGIVPKPPGSAGPADLKATARPAVLDAGRSELQKATPVGVISRPLQQRQIVPVPPPPSHDMSAPPGSIRIATRFEVDDTMQSPQGLAGVPSHPLPLPPAPGPHGALPPPPHAPIEPYTPPPGPPTTTSSATSRVVFYGLLIATVVVTFFVVRRMHLGVPAVKHTSPSTTPTPTESAPALPPPPPPHSAKH